MLKTGNETQPTDRLRTDMAKIKYSNAFSGKALKMFSRTTENPRKCSFQIPQQSNNAFTNFVNPHIFFP
jgi:hypothetical protein